VDHLLALGDNHMVTIVIPEFIPARWWQQLLHNQTALLIKGALLFRRNVVVTDVPYHLVRQRSRARRRVSTRRGLPTGAA
jgi:hypothetical protein